jgi:Fe-S oxidoreductase
MLDEYLQRAHPGWRPSPVKRRALVQGHCHEMAVLEGPHVDLLERLGVKAEVLDSGCCGMAGGFGYEREHHDVSVACGERSLLPSVRKAPEDALVIADGFSCRQQIRQLTPRNAVHMVKVLEMSLEQTQSLAERESSELQRPVRRKVRAALPVAIGVAALSFGAMLLRRRRRR